MSVRRLHGNILKSRQRPKSPIARRWLRERDAARVERDRLASIVTRLPVEALLLAPIADGVYKCGLCEAEYESEDEFLKGHDPTCLVPAAVAWVNEQGVV